jgi:hypothetical protein
MSMKNSSDTIENRTRNLPASSAVPEQNAPTVGSTDSSAASLPLIANTCFFFSVFIMHAPAVPNVRTKLVQTYKLHDFFSRPHLPRRHVCSATRSYTDSPGLAEIAAERTRGAGLHGQRKCSHADRPQVTVTLRFGSRTRLHVRERLSRAAERDTCEFYSHV